MYVGLLPECVRVSGCLELELQQTVGSCCWCWGLNLGSLKEPHSAYNCSLSTPSVCLLITCSAAEFHLQPMPHAFSIIDFMAWGLEGKSFSKFTDNGESQSGLWQNSTDCSSDVSQVIQLNLVTSSSTWVLDSTTVRWWHFDTMSGIGTFSLRLCCCLPVNWGYGLQSESNPSQVLSFMKATVVSFDGCNQYLSLIVCPTFFWVTESGTVWWEDWGDGPMTSGSIGLLPCALVVLSLRCVLAQLRSIDENIFPGPSQVAYSLSSPALPSLTSTGAHLALCAPSF